MGPAVPHYVAEPPKVESVDISKFPLQASEISVHEGSSAELSSVQVVSIIITFTPLTFVCNIR